MRTAMVAICFTVSFITPAFAHLVSDETTANLSIACKQAIQMIEDKNYDGQYYDGTFCLGFIQGFMQALDYEQSLMRELEAQKIKLKTFPPIKNGFICYPDGRSTYQVAKIFVKYVDDHPKQLNEYASKTLLFALLDAFNCDK